MIINLRGTSGAGKSTVVRAIMVMYPHVQPEYLDGRRQPISYFLQQDANLSRPPLRVLGHYESPCGGCDTISMPGAVDYTYKLAKDSAKSGTHVMMEGIMIQDDVRRCIETSKEHDLVVLGLKVPIELCLAGIQSRRDGRGDSRPLNPTNTIARAKRVESRMAALKKAGVRTEWVTREEAVARCVVLLGL